MLLVLCSYYFTVSCPCSFWSFEDVNLLSTNKSNINESFNSILSNLAFSMDVLASLVLFKMYIGFMLMLFC